MNQVGKRLKMAVIHDILPEEILVYIFKMLDIKSLFFSWATCRKWKYLIIEFDLFNLKNFSKFQTISRSTLLFQCGYFRILREINFGEYRS